MGQGGLSYKKLLAFLFLFIMSCNGKPISIDMNIPPLRPSLEVCSNYRQNNYLYSESFSVDHKNYRHTYSCQTNAGQMLCDIQFEETYKITYENCVVVN